MQIFTNELEKIIEVKIKPNLKTIYNMRIKGLNDRHIARYLGISVTMFLKAVEECELLKETYNDATVLLCSELREVAIERALGLDGKVDKDGNEVGPDANLAVRILEKLDPAFSTKVTHTVDETSIEEIIKAMNEKRRLELEKREAIIEKNDKKGYEII